MADMLIKMKTGTLTKMLQQQNGQPAVSLDKGSVYFAVDTATHKGKIIYDAPLDPNGVDRIVMSTDAETAEKDSAGNIITSTYATKTELNSYVPDNAMVYIGTIATANDVPNVYKAGWTYKVVTAGTYAGKTCEVGDLVICTKDNNNAASASNDDWIVIQTNVNKALYRGANSFTNEYMLLADGTAGKVKAVNVNPTVTLTAGTSSSSPKFKFSVGGKESNEVSIGTATETNFGAVKISSATDSNDDLTAATSAAVKAVYDFAATKTSNVGTITGVTAGAGLTGGGTSGNVTLSHSNSIAATTTEALYKLKYDAQGHITGALAQGITDNTTNKDVTSSDNNLITARTLYYQLAKKGYTTNTGTVTSVGSGEGLTGGPVTTTGSLSHAIPEDAAAGTKGTAGGRTYLQQITTDKFGHVTGFLTATETVTDTHHTAKTITTNSDTSKTQTTTALTNGNVYLNVIENGAVRSHHKISGTNLIGVTTDTSGNIKIDHTVPTGASATTYGGGNRTYVTSITSDAYGHITGVLTGQETVSNTDTKVNVTLGTTTKAYLLGTSTAPTSSAQAVEAISDTGVYLDTTAGKLTAGSFAGSGASLTSLNASNISSGTLNAARLATSGVTAGVYQGLTVDTYGRVTGAIDKDYATKTELNNLIAAADALVYKGTLAGANTSPGTFTPAADCGHVYKVSTGGYINGQKVEAGDMFICTADSTVAATSSNYSTVQATWSIVQTNTDGIVIGPDSATNGNIPLFDGTTGKLIKNSSYKPSSFATSGHDHDSVYVKKSGDTMTGILKVYANQYTDDYTTCGINMQNSDIVGLNSIYTGDSADGAGEGIHFYRDSTHVDTLWMHGGDILFVPNRALGTNTSKANSQKVGRFTENPTSGQVVVSDGTTGGIKTTGYTIAASVPSGAKFTDTTYSAGTGISLSGTTFSNSGVTGVKGNAETNYRTGQVNLTPANIGAAAASHTHILTDIVKEQSNAVASLDPITQAMIGSAASNKSFGLPASAIKIEYSTNGGSSWTDYGATDAQKVALFNETRGFAAIIGKSASASTNTTNNQLRITIEPTDRYVSFDGIYVWMSTTGNTVVMDLDHSTIGAKDTFTNIFTGQSLAGWSGNNIRYFSGGAFGGGSTQTNNWYKYRITFRQTAVNTSYNSASIIDIRFLGLNVWTSPNNMVAKNHMYTWDNDYNVTFPAGLSAATIDATKLSGTIPSSCYTNTTYTFDGTYNASSNKAATVSTVTNAINALDGNLNNTTPGAGKTLTAFSQTNGKISATFGNISITKSQISDFPTSMTPTSHAHGNITNDGKIGTAANKAAYTTTDGVVTAGTLPAAAGGTGKTTLKDAANALINALDTGSSNLTANDYVITQYVGGGTTTTTYHRRPASALRVGGLLTARNLGVNLASTTAVTFDGTANQTNIPVSGTLPIANGGTGATDAATARTNLGITPANIGAATSGHTHDNYMVKGVDYVTAGKDSSITMGTGATAEGNGTKPTGNYSHAEGGGTEASGSQSHAEGENTTASGSCSHAEGFDSEASGDYSHAEGYNTKATKNYSHAEGYMSKAQAQYSHAEGYSTTITSDGGYGHAEGASTTVSGNYGHAEGYGTKATATHSHAEGGYTEATSNAAHSEGYGAKATGDYSHAEGYYTQALSSGAHAEGYNSKAVSSSSHAEGYNSVASGDYSHAEGRNTTAAGWESHAEGNSTAAAGLTSHAEGDGTVASGYASHAEGIHTIANHESQHVFGEYNIPDSSGTTASSRGNYVEIVGNGTTSSACSNARTLDWNGNEVLAGSLTVGAAKAIASNESVMLQYNSTTKSLDFIFA